ncbi:MAG: hypothetical protein ACI3WQ_02420 [Faecousia sp.]
MKKTMKHKHLHVRRPCQPIYPNAADNRYFAQKALDIITAIVSVAGFVSAMAFLVTMS